MNKYELVKRIENFAPPEMAQEWDCSGFICETKNTEIKRVMLCLTPTSDVIKQAIKCGCDMVVSHHPMFYFELLPLVVTDDFSPLLDIYCAHTNMDLAKGGTTDTLIEAIVNHAGLQAKTINSDEGFLRYFEFEDYVDVGKFTDVLRKISPNLRYVNNFQTDKVKKIALCAGSGAEFIQEAVKNGADCYITGDLKFHTTLDTTILTYDIGHFESEIIILPVFKRIIGDDVEVLLAFEKSPFNY